MSGVAVLAPQPGQVFLSKQGGPAGDEMAFAVAGIPPFGTQVSGIFTFAPARAQPVLLAPDPTVFIWLDAGPGGNAPSSAGTDSAPSRGSLQQPDGMTYEPVGPGMSPPAQRISLLNFSAGPGAGLLPAPDPSPQPSPDVRLAARPLTEAQRKRTHCVAAGLAREAPNDLPGPMSADLIAEVLSIDRAALAAALDPFFRQFEELEAVDFIMPGRRQVVILALAMAGTWLTAEIVRRRWHGGTARSGNPARLFARRTTIPAIPSSPGAGLRGCHERRSPG